MRFWNGSRMGGPEPFGGNEARTEVSKRQRWVVCANVSHHLHGGSDPEKFYQGSRMFSPGTKVYIGEAYWGMAGSNLHAIGLHRLSRDFVNCVVKIEYLEKLRLKPVYSQNMWDKLLALGGALFHEREPGLSYLECLETARRTPLPSKLQSEPRSEISGD